MCTLLWNAQNETVARRASRRFIPVEQNDYVHTDLR
jgi:hypothetical protein